jgi:hypothetical protein
MTGSSLSGAEWQVASIPEDVQELLMSKWPDREMEFCILAMRPKTNEPSIVSYTVGDPPVREEFGVDAKTFCIPRADQKCLCPVSDENYQVMIMYESSPPVLVTCVGNQCRQVAP